ncbi:MAG: Rnase Y domain-containing protein, partial [Bacteroidia bacterium]|nr:Rnase Y domain-containing protein [Bacteroidia bacterium]
MLVIILAFLLGAAVALAIYIFLHKRSLNGKKEEILERAELEGENIKKEKIFQAKEKYLQLKSEHEQYVNEKNSQIRDTENRLKQKEN